jgi:LCP family protein required for cell wall assembly
VLIGSVSVAVILKNNESILSDMFSKTEQTTVADDTTINNAVELPELLSGRTRVLVYCTDREKEEFYFMAMVDADIGQNRISVHPFTADNPEYVRALSTGGHKALIAEVEKAEGVQIDKYVASDTDTFALAINYMGGLKYTVAERIEYRTDDYTLILTKGNQTIKGETLLKYFRYCKTLGEEQGLKQQGDLICKMLDEYITTENVEKGDTIYEKVLSKINSQSDISHIEASKTWNLLKFYCESGKRQPATVIL